MNHSTPICDLLCRKKYGLMRIKKLSKNECLNSGMVLKEGEKILPNRSYLLWFYSFHLVYKYVTFCFSLFYEPDDFYTECKHLLSNPNGGVAIAKGWSITKLDVIEKLAYLEDGSTIHYGKCLLATGDKRFVIVYLSLPYSLLS